MKPAQPVTKVFILSRDSFLTIYHKDFLSPHICLRNPWGLPLVPEYMDQESFLTILTTFVRFVIESHRMSVSIFSNSDKEPKAI
jgi:hypothetical protein